MIKKFNKFESKSKNTPLFTGNVDLRKCKKGDILISCHGAILEYISPTPHLQYTYLDHVVRYIENSERQLKFYRDDNYGSRTDDGYYTFNKNNCLPSDHNIVLIIPFESLIDKNFINSVEDQNLVKYLHSISDKLYMLYKLEIKKNTDNFNL